LFTAHRTDTVLALVHSLALKFLIHCYNLLAVRVTFTDFTNKFGNSTFMLSFILVSLFSFLLKVIIIINLLSCVVSAEVQQSSPPPKKLRSLESQTNDTVFVESNSSQVTAEETLFNITLLVPPDSQITAENFAAFVKAKQRWEEVIKVGFAGYVNVQANSEWCSSPTYTFEQDTSWNDLLIIVDVRSIDGAASVFVYRLQKLVSKVGRLTFSFHQIGLYRNMRNFIWFAK
jgi:hypothetical protein